MIISPNSMVKLREEHSQVAATAARELEGLGKQAARHEQKQAEKAQLIYVTEDMTRLAVNSMDFEDKEPIPMPFSSGWVIFENGSGLKQICSPFPTDFPSGTGYPEAEIFGIFYFHDHNENIVVNPIFKAEDLRSLSPHALPKRFYTNWAPFNSHQLLSEMSSHESLRNVHYLLRALFSLMPIAQIEETKVRTQVKKKGKSVPYWLVDVPENKPVEEPISPEQYLPFSFAEGQAETIVTWVFKDGDIQQSHQH